MVCLSEKVMFDQKPEGGREPWRQLKDMICLMFRIVPVEVGLCFFFSTVVG